MDSQARRLLEAVGRDNTPHSRRHRLPSHYTYGTQAFSCYCSDHRHRFGVRAAGRYFRPRPRPRNAAPLNSERMSFVLCMIIKPNYRRSDGNKRHGGPGFQKRILRAAHLSGSDDRHLVSSLTGMEKVRSRCTRRGLDGSQAHLFATTICLVSTSSHIASGSNVMSTASCLCHSFKASFGPRFGCQHYCKG
jgi:hypothetical protein